MKNSLLFSKNACTAILTPWFFLKQSALSNKSATSATTKPLIAWSPIAKSPLVDYATSR